MRGAGGPLVTVAQGFYWFLKNEVALMKLLCVTVNSPVTCLEGGDSRRGTGTSPGLEPEDRLLCRRTGAGMQGRKEVGREQGLDRAGPRVMVRAAAVLNCGKST